MKKLLLSTIALGLMTLTAGAQATGSLDAPLTVDEILAQGAPDAAVPNTYVKGYIVGYVDGQTLSKGAKFDLSSGTISETNLLLASSSSEDNYEMCIPVQLPSGNVRKALNLSAHPENIYHEVIICGSHEKYFGVNGMKSITSYEWVGEAPVPDPSTKPGVDVTGTKESPITVTKFIELGSTPSVDGTWVTGFIVGSVKTNGMSMKDAEFGVSADSSVSNILIAATANPASAEECIPVQLPKGDIRTALNLLDNPGNLGKTLVICGTREAYFSVPGLKSPTEFTLDGQGVVTPEPVIPEGQFYKGLTSNADDWTLNVGTIPEGLNYVWAWDNAYGLKGSAYYNNTRFETSVWAISPVINLTNATEATLTFSQTANYLNGNTALIVTAIREENGEWNPIEVAPQPAGNNWTFVDSSASLNNYCGKKIQIGFNYNSTLTDAPTWEIKNLAVNGQTALGVEAVAAEAVYALNGNIIAPEGARAFNLSGVETGLYNLPAGIYVVVVADKAVKVLVK